MPGPNDSRNIIGTAPSVIAALALAAVGSRMLSSKRIEDENTITDRAVSSEHSFSDDLLSAPIDKVYLFTFPRAHHVHNISPFSLKLETFLRIHNIPYEVISTFQFSPKGQIPYIRLNSKEDGTLIADSNFIIKFLSKKLGIDKTEEHFLSSEEMAVAHAFTRMIEEHTTQIGFYYRYALNMEKFCSAVIPLDWFNHNNSLTLKAWLFLKFWKRIQPIGFKKKMRYVSFGRHTDDEKWTISCQDIQSISDFLGDKKYIFGDRVTTLDCTLFGHFAQFLYIPIDFPQKKYMLENCINVVRYVERLKEEYWSDWDKIV
eukprot:CCRYP_017097-RA/>CCRYP_017097-RA protein AED:0.41 eAED:0.41 QI:0/-1/0/1/-1/1/1/0/315